MTVYIVTAEYTDGWTSIEGVFTTRPKAEALVEEKSSQRPLVKYDIEEHFAI